MISYVVAAELRKFDFIEVVTVALAELAYFCRRIGRGNGADLMNCVKIYGCFEICRQDHTGNYTYIYKSLSVKQFAEFVMRRTDLVQQEGVMLAFAGFKRERRTFEVGMLALVCREALDVIIFGRICPCDLS